MNPVVILAGPPFSGKDTIAKALCRMDSGYKHEKFTKPLDDAIKKLYSLSKREYNQLNQPRVKEQSSDKLYGASLRQVKNEMSNFMHRFHKCSMFAPQLPKRVPKNKIPVVSDGGKLAEVREIQSFYDPIILVNVRREGYEHFPKQDNRTFFKKTRYTFLIEFQNDENFDESVRELHEFIQSAESSLRYGKYLVPSFR